MTRSLKDGFRRFLAADPARLHFAAHSHHPWPDVSYQAQLDCWNDAARLADLKWAKVFGEIVPAVQAKIARLLGLSDPATLAFGPNSHGFLLRLLSCLPAGRPLRVLTTDGEFHSFTRQMRRLEEAGLADVERVACAPYDTLPERLAARDGAYDLVYISQVFYDSGFVLTDLAGLVEHLAAPERLVVIDGYHGFTAWPTDLAPIEQQAFYLAGGYKYAMAGEGAALLHAPPGLALRPRDTGWFAHFQALEAGPGGALGYDPGGARFMGATFDPVGLYRLNAALDWLAESGVTVTDRLAWVHGLQARFVAQLEELGLRALHPGQLAVPISEPRRGHFLTFRTAEACALQARLLARGVVTDARGERLRLSFGIYHDEGDVDRLIEVLRGL